MELHAKQNPDQDVSGNNGGQGEGNADLEEVAVGNFVAFLAQDADAGDVGGSADGGAVAAQGGAGQQTEVQGGGVDAHLHGDAGR